jgi:hypothetical protein
MYPRPFRLSYNQGWEVRYTERGYFRNIIYKLFKLGESPFIPEVISFEDQIKSQNMPQPSKRFPTENKN